MTEQAVMEPTTVAERAQARPAAGDGALDEALVAEEGTVDRAGEEALVADELLVEEVSIDGMCGVY